MLHWRSMNACPVLLAIIASRPSTRGIALSDAGAGCDVAVHDVGHECATLESVAHCRGAAASSNQQFVPTGDPLASASEGAAIACGDSASRAATVRASRPGSIILPGTLGRSK